MYLKEPINRLFDQLSLVLAELSDEQYKEKIPAMSGATIGQHIRHIIEIYTELYKGYDYGTVNYDRRKRDPQLESDRALAVLRIDEIEDLLVQPDKQLLHLANYSLTETEGIAVHSSYFRELVYNLEHTVHHMALIRIAVSSISTIRLPEDFGLAISTLKYRQTCVQ
ncbi:hypothetical protein [Pedobacter gandavensis]|uniref:hypothetical protein n=1 Tax=Pedobacter gandavensis TaxID=2679963 RepID=UPI002930F53D|nr:hypothetical protein [Pedobacter gandavensis]